jgi:hypothetical protein
MHLKSFPVERRAAVVRFRDFPRLAAAANSGSDRAALFLQVLYHCTQVIEGEAGELPVCELCARHVNQCDGGALAFFPPDQDPASATFDPLCAYCAAKSDREIFDICRKLFPQVNWIVALNEGDAP